MFKILSLSKWGPTLITTILQVKFIFSEKEYLYKINRMLHIIIVGM